MKLRHNLKKNTLLNKIEFYDRQKSKEQVLLIKVYLECKKKGFYN